MPSKSVQPEFPPCYRYQRHGAQFGAPSAILWKLFNPRYLCPP